MKLYELMIYLTIATVILNVVVSFYLFVQVNRLWVVSSKQIELNEGFVETDRGLIGTDSMIIDLLKEVKGR